MKKAIMRTTAGLAAWAMLGVAIPFGSSQTGWGPEVPLTSGGAGVASGAPVAVGEGPAGIPQRAFQAYASAANHPTNDCRVRWEDLAAIGMVESRHGTAYNSTILDDGMVVKTDDHSKPGVLGPALNGSGVGGNITPMRAPAEAAQWGVTGGFDRAVGPMQHLSREFARNGVDADGDGKRNPHDFDDAALSSIRHLCDDKNYEPDGTRRRTAIRRYNGSGPNAERYATQALKLAAEYSAAAPGVQTASRSVAVASIGPGAVTSGSGGLGGAAAWWRTVGQSWGDYGFPATLTGAWVDFINPVGGGGGVPAPIAGAGDGVYPDGKTIERGPSSALCASGYRAAADPRFCAPPDNPTGGPMAHPQMTLDISRAVKGWLDRNGQRENLGSARPYHIAPPTHCTHCARRSDHKWMGAIDVPGFSPKLDPLGKILCRHTTNSRWCRAQDVDANPNGALSVLLFTGDAGHTNHIHISLNKAGNGAAVQALIADLGGLPVDLDRSWRPRVQYGGTTPTHVTLT